MNKLKMVSLICRPQLHGKTRVIYAVFTRAEGRERPVRAKSFDRLVRATQYLPKTCGVVESGGPDNRAPGGMWIAWRIS